MTRPVEPRTGERLPNRVEEAFRSHRRELLGMARLLTGSPDRAEEVVQEAFLTLHRRLGDTEPGRELAYLRRAVISGPLRMAAPSDATAAPAHRRRGPDRPPHAGGGRGRGVATAVHRRLAPRPESAAAPSASALRRHGYRQVRSPSRREEGAPALAGAPSEVASGTARGTGPGHGHQRRSIPDATPATPPRTVRS